jgi:hypothetical protein
LYWVHYRELNSASINGLICSAGPLGLIAASAVRRAAVAMHADQWQCMEISVMARRTIFDHTPNPVELFDELYFHGERDFLGLPLGDVAGHVRRRYTACYGALCLARMLTDIGRIDEATTINVVGAHFQDKRTSTEFPAAHVIPCDLLLTLPGHPLPGVHLYELLRNPFNQTWVKLHIFGQTDRVHRLVNVADRSCEADTDGMALAFASACENVITSGLAARRLSGSRSAPPISAPVLFQLETEIMPRFTAVASARLRALEHDLTPSERIELTREHTLDRFGKPAVERSIDTRLGSPDAQARAAARIALHQVLAIYTDATLVDRSELMAISGQVQALRINETER